MSVTIVHTADIHVRGLSRHEEYRHVFEAFVTKLAEIDPDFLVIAGDVVHSKTQNITPESIDLLTWWFRKLTDVCPVVVTLGNHDGLLTNLDRQDAVSPIVSALGIDRLKLLKDSGNFDLKELFGTLRIHKLPNVRLCNFSPFDEPGWANVVPDPDAINIALYHGPVKGCKTDTNWELSSGAPIGMFNGFDFGLFGDIHKRQFLDAADRLAYPGSLIQQNYGEENDKGFLVWKISSRDDYSTKYVSVPNPYSSFTFEWAGTPEATLDEISIVGKLTDRPNIRITCSSQVTQSDKRAFSRLAKERLRAGTIAWKLPTHVLDATGPTVATSTPTANVLDYDYLLRRVEEYGRANFESEIDRAGLGEKLREVLEELAHNDPTVPGTWSLGSLRFDNLFNFGEGNEVDFENAEGLVGVFGRNRVGKSSLVASIAYALFNGNDRGIASNLDVINVRKNHCFSGLEFTKQGKRYRTERQTVKYTSKRGDVGCNTVLNFMEIGDDGAVATDMTDEQRRSTETALRNLVGLQDDTLLTSFATQGQLTRFIDDNPGARKLALNKILGLDVFDDLARIARDKASEVKGRLKAIPDIDFATVIATNEEKIAELENDRIELTKKITTVTDRAKEIDELILTEKLSITDDNKLTKLESQLESWQGKATEARDALEKIESALDGLLDEETELLSRIDPETELELRNELEAVEQQKKRSETLEGQLRLKRELRERLRKSVELLSSVPCGDEYPSCKFIRQSHDDRTKLRDQDASIEADEATLREVLATIDSGAIERLRASLAKSTGDRKRLVEVKHAKESAQHKQQSTLSLLETVTSQVAELETELEELRKKVSPDTHERTLALESERKATQTKLAGLEKKRQAVSESIGLFRAKLSEHREQGRLRTELSAHWSVYELMVSAFSRKGLPSSMLTERLPEINSILRDIMLEDADFGLEFRVTPDSKKLEVYIDYGDSCRAIECGSGMEKMIASLAIRAALHAVSRLPKPDFMVIDEGFGSLDSGNVEMCIRMLRSLLKIFRFVLIISHVEDVKDSVDCMIEIERVGLDSQVRFT